MTGSSVVIVKPSSLGDIVHTLPAVHNLPGPISTGEGTLEGLQRASPSDNK
jgi:hypothetical protein